MQAYETIFIARPDLSATQVDALAIKFQDVLKAQGGKLEGEENWGLRTLAYPINKHRKGHYRYFTSTASGAAIQEMERQMRLNEDIMRFMTVKVDVLETGPSAIMRASDAPAERRPAY